MLLFLSPLCVHNFLPFPCHVFSTRLRRREAETTPLSPLRFRATFAEIVRERSTKHYSAFPYVVRSLRLSLLRVVGLNRLFDSSEVSSPLPPFLPSDFPDPVRAVGGVLHPHASHENRTLVHEFCGNHPGGAKWSPERGVEDRLPVIINT